jgi:uncharacterized OB-fold protein
MIPTPVPSELTRPFWDGVRHGVLLVPECQACGARFFNPEALCVRCGASGWKWVPSPGVGEVYTFSVVHQPIVADQPVPFVLAAVDLDDGWTIMTHIIDVDPDTVRIGMRVSFARTLLRDDVFLPTFAPLAGAGEGR